MVLSQIFVLTEDTTIINTHTQARVCMHTHTHTQKDHRDLRRPSEDTYMRCQASITVYLSPSVLRDVAQCRLVAGYSCRKAYQSHLRQPSSPQWYISFYHSPQSNNKFIQEFY